MTNNAVEIAQAVEEIRQSDDYRNYVATARILNYVDHIDWDEWEELRGAQNNNNFGWIGWINENAGRQAMAVAVGVCAGALIWKLAVMRN